VLATYIGNTSNEYLNYFELCPLLDHPGFSVSITGTKTMLRRKTWFPLK